MLSSIHPLGERSRQNRWLVTVGFFTMGAILAGSAVGLVLGFVGSLTLTVLGGPPALIITAGIALVAGVLDAMGLSPPGPSRQVNEHWIGTFRGWVYGGAFGVELGIGFMTYIVTWGIYATYGAAILTTSPMAGAAVGAVFGAGRSILLLLAGRVDRPSRLTSFNRRLVVAGPIVRRSAAALLALAGAAMIVAGSL